MMTKEQYRKIEFYNSLQSIEDRRCLDCDKDDFNYCQICIQISSMLKDIKRYASWGNVV